MEFPCTQLCSKSLGSFYFGPEMKQAKKWKSHFPWLMIKPALLDSKSYILWCGYNKSWLVMQGSTSESYTYHYYKHTDTHTTHTYTHSRWTCKITIFLISPGNPMLRYIRIGLYKTPLCTHIKLFHAEIIKNNIWIQTFSSWAMLKQATTRSLLPPDSNMTVYECQLCTLAPVTHISCKKTM